MKQRINILLFRDFPARRTSTPVAGVIVWPVKHHEAVMAITVALPLCDKLDFADLVRV
jgi:hypothetical protein